MAIITGSSLRFHVFSDQILVYLKSLKFHKAWSQNMRKWCDYRPRELPEAVLYQASTNRKQMIGRWFKHCGGWE